MAYLNATVAKWILTDENGWARIIVLEKMINAITGHLIGNYTAEVAYGACSHERAVKMTENK